METITAFKYDLGMTARDTISGFEGTIVSRVQHLFGCSQYGIAPMATGSDGQTLKTEYFDEARIAITGNGVKPAEARLHVFDEIFAHAIGSEACDKVTGFTGTIVYRAEYLYNANAYLLLPSVDSEGKTREAEAFDEGRLAVVGNGVTTEEVASPRRGALVNRDAPQR